MIVVGYKSYKHSITCSWDIILLTVISHQSFCCACLGAENDSVNWTNEIHSSHVNYSCSRIHTIFWARQEWHHQVKWTNVNGSQTHTCNRSTNTQTCGYSIRIYLYSLIQFPLHCKCSMSRLSNCISAAAKLFRKSQAFCTASSNLWTWTWFRSSYPHGQTNGPDHHRFGRNGNPVWPHFLVRFWFRPLVHQLRWPFLESDGPSLESWFFVKQPTRQRGTLPMTILWPATFVLLLIHGWQSRHHICNDIYPSRAFALYIFTVDQCSSLARETALEVCSNTPDSNQQLWSDYKPCRGISLL